MLLSLAASAATVDFANTDKDTVYRTGHLSAQNSHGDTRLNLNLFEPRQSVDNNEGLLIGLSTVGYLGDRIRRFLDGLQSLFKLAFCRS